MKRPLLIACVLPFLFPVTRVAAESMEQLLARGNEHLTSGHFNDAVASFDTAIVQDPKNYASYYKRATAYLSLGRNQAALEDFSTILRLKPDFYQALRQRARIYAKEGEFSMARNDLQKYTEQYPNDESATLLLEAVNKAEAAMESALASRDSSDYDACIRSVSEAVKTASHMVQLRLTSAQCHLYKGEVEEAAGDLTRAVHLAPSDATTLLQLAKINYFSLDEPESAISQMKQCLHYDPEQKQCKSLFRLIKRLEKTLKTIKNDMDQKRYATAANKLLGTTTKRGVIAEVDEQFAFLQKELKKAKVPKRLHLKCYECACKSYAQQTPTDKAKVDQWCEATLNLDPDNLEALTRRGELRFKEREYEEAARDFEKANEISGGKNRRLQQLLQKAQQRLKQMKRHDYYKILDVSPTADAREIKKAYRKKAHEWHPDKHDEESKKKAEQRMAEINQAYEVLSDDDMRQQYDNGFDPYDPELQQQQGAGAGSTGGHNPFHHHNSFAHFQDGGFPFGGAGGPFTFKMNF